jgi:hypothetical protein
MKVLAAAVGSSRHVAEHGPLDYVQSAIVPVPLPTEALQQPVFAEPVPKMLEVEPQGLVSEPFLAVMEARLPVDVESHGLPPLGIEPELDPTIPSSIMAEVAAASASRAGEEPTVSLPMDDGCRHPTKLAAAQGFFARARRLLGRAASLWK